MLPATAPYQSASLYVGDLHPDATEAFLFEIFNRVGPVASIRVCRDTVTRRSLGYAYVNFHELKDAERALDTMNFTDIKGKPCRIMWSQRDPSLRRSGVGNVFVNNLAPSVDNKGLFDVFSVFGNILSCKVVSDESGNSKGYGYVHYETAEAAQEAIQKVNGVVIEDQEVIVSPFLRRQDRSSQNDWTNLYCKHFPESWTEDKLKEVFSEYGTINSCKLAVDDEGKSKRFGFVDFADHASAEKALSELNGKIFETGTMTEGKEGEPSVPKTFELYVNRAQKRTERTRELKHRVDIAKAEQINKSKGRNLYVKNIDDALTDDEFRELFTPFGTITSSRIMRDDGTGSGKGFAFVCYSSPEEATRAVTEMNGKMIRAKPLYVCFHQPKDHRRAQLAQTHGPGGRGMGNMPRFPMGQAPLPYMYMNSGQPIPPRQPYPIMPGGMMPRGQTANRGGPGYPMPQYNMGTPGQQGGYRRGGPVNIGGHGPRASGRGGAGGRSMPPQQSGRGMGAPAMKYNTQARNQPGMQQQQMGGMPAVQQEAPAQIPLPSGPLDHSTLAQADPQTQKNLIGERLYTLIFTTHPKLAGKITGMLLEMDNSELVHLLESPEALSVKVQEALDVLQAHNQGL
mmetsp:Transcript_8755/g.13083  ORF Transcript_8755/g.13083 Transcript_8755/m.13083 type:complete len:625 (-) Transcript_8755:210-2084(-)